MHPIIKTKSFKNTLYSLLKEYNGISFNLMISGGSLLSCLDDERYSSLNTSKWNIYFADERCNKEYLNYMNAKEFLQKTKAKVHKIEIKEDLEESRKEYSNVLDSITVDICLLGIGENGHICSLWPNSESLNSRMTVELVEVDCPLSPKRITTTICFINEQVKSLYFVIPPKNGKPKEITEPDESILKKLKIKFQVILPSE